MKRILVGLICLFLVFPCYSMDYSGIGKEVAERTNNELEEEIKDVLDMDEIRWLLQSQRDFKRLEYMRYLQEEVRRKAHWQRQLNNSGHLFSGILQLGIAYWGFKQENAYGNVTGSLFVLSGIVQIITIKW